MAAAFTCQHDRFLHEQLRLGTRNQHGRIHCEAEPIELLPSGDVLEGDARCPPLNESRKLLPTLSGERLGERTEHAGAVPAKDKPQ